MTFDRWFSEARAFIDEKGRLPLPDDSPFDMTDALDDAIQDAAFRPTEFERAIPPHDPFDPAERCVVLTFLAALIDYKPFLAEEDEQIVKERVRAIFRAALDLMPTADCSTPWQVHWEIAAAAIGSAWNRIPALGERWCELAPNETGRARSDVACALFQSVHPLFGGPQDDGDRRFRFLPYNDRDIAPNEKSFGELHEYIIYRSALLLTPTPELEAQWTKPESLASDSFDRVLTASTVLEGLAATTPLSLTMKAVSAWCTYARGVRSGESALLGLAGERFLTLKPHPRAMGLGDDAQRILSCAATCYERANRSDDAEKTLQRWTQEFPDDPEAWRRLAVVCGRVGAYDEAHDAFETFARLSPVTEGDWQATLLLKLGFELKAVISESAPSLRPMPAFGQALLAWTWPNFPQLSSNTQQRWWTGLAHVCVPEMEHILGPAFRWVAGAAFGEAVATELRVWVVGPLAEHLQHQRHWRKLIDEANSQDRTFARRLEQQTLPFGHQIKLFQMAKAPHTPMAEAIAPWIRQNRGLLLSHITSQVTSAKVEALVQARNRGVHDVITDEQLHTLHETARGVLDMICAERISKAKGRR